MGSAFSKDPGSAFCECLGPGPGPLYKVCCSILVASKRLLMLLALNSHETLDAFFNSVNSRRKVKTRPSKLGVSVTISGLAPSSTLSKVSSENSSKPL